MQGQIQGGRVEKQLLFPAHGPAMAPSLAERGCSDRSHRPSNVGEHDEWASRACSCELNDESGFHVGYHRHNGLIA